MPESRKRGGKKAHNKRVKARNEKIKNDYTAAAKKAWTKFEQWKTENADKDDKGFSTLTTK